MEYTAILMLVLLPVSTAFDESTIPNDQPDYPDPAAEAAKENISLTSNADKIVFCGSDYCVMESGNILHCGFLSNSITYCPNEEE